MYRIEALAEMPVIELGRWNAGAGRRYRFKASWPDPAGPLTEQRPDSDYIGSRVQTRFVWSARP